MSKINQQDAPFNIRSVNPIKWAEEFLSVIKYHPTVPQNGLTMSTWFANAICAGIDHANEIHKHACKLELAAQIEGHKKLVAVIDELLLERVKNENAAVNENTRLRYELREAHTREDELAEALRNLVREEKKDDDDPNLYIARVNSETALIRHSAAKKERDKS